ncbi:MAG: GMC family oxidoreductase, partial [Gammaproteobacteria bacterium]|nr:GMC family oxidoreductase [Gammaproteobacteria bacterium]
MPQLSSPQHLLDSHYPIVVIGSGYGGAIMASRLSRANQSVCLLEQGREFQVGDYPNHPSEIFSNLQI